MYADIYIFCNVRFVSFDITFFALNKICEYTYTHTHTRVTPLSSYLILATLTKAKCTLIGNYWTSVFFERKKILALTSTFLHPFTSSLSLSRTFISIAILVSQFFTWYLSSTNRHYSEIYHRGRRKQARKGSIVRLGESTLRSARGFRNEEGTRGYSPRDRVNPITRKAAAAAAAL